MSKIGFIGLGIMGSRMATNLQKNGYELVVHNRSRDKASTLIENGATWADTPAAAAMGADILMTMLGDPTAVEAMARGENGFLSGLSAGTVWVDCSTVNPTFSREMAALANERGVRFLDAPVAGSKNQAAEAQLTFIVGGAPEDVETATPLFEKMGQRIVHVGGVGMGTSLKIVLNMQLAISMAAFAEGVALGRSLGIAEEVLQNVLIGSPVAAPFLQGKRERMSSGTYDAPDFPLVWMQKDVHLATLTAYETHTSALLASVTKELFGQAIRDGYGNSDFSAIYHHLNSDNDSK